MGPHGIVVPMITQNRVLFLIGLITLLIPLLGFPSVYESFATGAAGVAVIILAFRYARNKRLNEIREVPRVEQKTEVFIESRPRFASDDEVFTDISSIRERARTVKSF